MGGVAVVKPDRGLMGQGIRRVSSAPEAVLAMTATRSGVLQEFLPCASTTLRVVCTDEQVIASYARVAAPDDWRANIAAGASAVPHMLAATDPVALLAVRSVCAFGLNFAGVDIVVTPTGPLLLEVNPAFGVAGLLALFPDAVERLVDHLASSRF